MLNKNLCANLIQFSINFNILEAIGTDTLLFPEKKKIYNVNEETECTAEQFIDRKILNIKQLLICTLLERQNLYY